jgi:flavodoxin
MKKIGIIVYSKTGNTFAVAEKIRDSLTAEGKEVTLERFMAETAAGSNTLIGLTTKPHCGGYDALIFGAPVQAFSLDPAMKLYLDQTEAIQAEKTICFVTQHFPKPWMGGNNAMRQMLALLKAKGIKAEKAGVVNWSGKTKDDQIAAIVRYCTEALS